MNKLRAIICVVIIVLGGVYCYAQQHTEVNDKGESTSFIHNHYIPHFTDSVIHEKGLTIYPYFFRMMDENQPISYIVYPGRMLMDNENKEFPITKEEGADGAHAELNLDMMIPLYHGGKGKSLLMSTWRAFLKYGTTIRAIRYSSSPMVPASIRFGAGFEKMLWVKVGRGNSGFNCLSTHSICSAVPSKLESISMFYFTGSFMHYSNGQESGVFIAKGANRNDYRNGDFSTNFLRGEIVFSHQFDQLTKQLTASVAYQKDFGSRDGFFAFFEEQEERYGNHRLQMMLQYQAPWAGGQLTIRGELEQILDKTALYPGKNKFRRGVHAYIKYDFKNIESVGLLFHYYRGRDYLNIRYDSAISTFQIGLSLKLDKLYAMRR